MESTFLAEVIETLAEKFEIKKFFFPPNTYYIQWCRYCTKKFYYRAAPDNYIAELKNKLVNVFYSPIHKAFPFWIRDHFLHTSSYCSFDCWKKAFLILNDKVSEDKKLEWFFIKLL